MKEFFGFFVLTLVAHFAVIGTVENFYVYGKPSPKLIDKIVYVVAGLTVALSTWHSPNSVDKYYCQNLNGRNANAKSQIHS